MNVGLRNGGGIADSMNPYEFGKDSKFGWKIVFDLSYFILINTIILNIVFGIIVDTFGDMRDEQFRRDEIVENTCLVCLNEKKEILETKNEFDDHIEHQHNIWNYVYFLNYLKHKPLKDLTMARWRHGIQQKKNSMTGFLLKKVCSSKKFGLTKTKKKTNRK
jgi:inositol 1,4,5-triphosphate receptor type 1